VHFVQLNLKISFLFYQSKIIKRRSNSATLPVFVMLFFDKLIFGRDKDDREAGTHPSVSCSLRPNASAACWGTNSGTHFNFCLCH
jgi:hypothetical protein